MMRRRLPLLLVPLLGGCGGIQSMTGADGRQGAIFTHLFWLFLAVTAIVYLVVIAFLIWAMVRRGRRQDGLPDEEASRDGILQPALIGWVAVITLILGGLTLASFFADRQNYAAAAAPRVEVQVTGHQWWWEINYTPQDPSQLIRTANELHLPAGIPVHIILKAGDVIHSFWVPNLAGKQDLIPGRVNDITLLAEHLGVYRGQCAEFCGLEHAHMALDVTVETPAEFAAWKQRQSRPAPAPATPLQQAGYTYFMNRECGTCHAITGTPASGSVAPDLTHIASRRTIGAGTFPNTPGHLYAWIADPQSAKPGNNMPTIGLEPGELHSLVAYLETLK